MGADKVHRSGRERAAHQCRQQSGQRDRTVELLLVLAVDPLERKFGQQVGEQIKRPARLILGGMLAKYCLA
jgi:hypothetical protein